MLWTPNEQPCFTDDNGVAVTPLEHWLTKFNWVRNKIIHKGHVPSYEYRQALPSGEASPYEGNYFNVAERLLRESILVSFVAEGHPDLWMEEHTRNFARTLAALKAGELTADD